jgi:uncharacterized protein
MFWNQEWANKQVKTKKPIFLVDAMLGKLTKKLRLLGYDTIYYSNKDDDELIQIAKTEKRILITKDVQLAKKCTKKQVENIELIGLDEIEQFIQINERVKLGKLFIKGNNSRCTLCNGVLEITEKKYVKNSIPEGVLENAEEFWKCKNCKKIYWEGTHITNLQKFMAKLNDRL